MHQYQSRDNPGVRGVELHIYLIDFTSGGFTLYFDQMLLMTPDSIIFFKLGKKLENTNVKQTLTKNLSKQHSENSFSRQ